MTNANPDEPWGEIKAPFTITSDMVSDGYPRGRPASDGGTSNGTQRPSGMSEPGMRVVNMASVKQQAVTWLWEHRIPNGKLSLIAGVPGKGKSFLTCDIAARLSAGMSWPDCPGQENRPGRVLMFCAEDGLEDTVAKRLANMGACLENIDAQTFVVSTEGKREHFNLGFHLRYLREYLSEHPDTRAVIIDPLMSYMGSADQNNESEVRKILQPVADVAEEFGVAIIGVMHIRKAHSDIAVYRVSGSVAFGAIARATWMVGGDNAEDADPDDRLFVCAKMNLARPAPGLRFSIVEPGVVAWDDEPVSESADDLYAGSGQQGGRGAAKREAAEAFLRDELEGTCNGMRQTELEKKAKRLGISRNTLKRAKQGLPVASSQHWDGARGVWYWQWNEQPAEGSDDDLPPI